MMRYFRTLTLLLLAIVSNGMVSGAESISKQVLFGDDLISENAIVEIRQLPSDTRQELALDLVRALKNTDKKVRKRAALGLQMIGRSAQKVVPVLLQAIHDDDPEVRCALMEALASIGPGAAEAVPDLMEALNDKTPKIREAAARALGYVGPTEYTVAGLAQALQDPDPAVRQKAAVSLGRMHSAAAKAVPALRQSLNDSSAPVRESVRDALGLIGTPEAIEALGK